MPILLVHCQGRNGWIHLRDKVPKRSGRNEIRHFIPIEPTSFPDGHFRPIIDLGFDFQGKEHDLDEPGQRQISTFALEVPVATQGSRIHRAIYASFFECLDGGGRSDCLAANQAALWNGPRVLSAPPDEKELHLTGIVHGEGYRAAPQ